MKRRNANNVDNVTNKALSTSSTSNRPEGRIVNFLTQQRLLWLNPIFKPKVVLLIFFGIGIIFISIGIIIMLSFTSIQEKVIDYTDCTNRNNPSVMCKEEIRLQPNATERDCYCTEEFTLEENWDKDVFMYYGLDNFYQNDRHYVVSRNDSQLFGQINDYDDSDTIFRCLDPFYKDANDTTYFPCGAIANSMFSDVITLKYNESNVSMIRTGIAWESDKKHKFKNPPNNGTVKDLMRQFQNFTKPKHWKKNLWELDIDNMDNNGLKNEDLIVWMRTAALPNFRKLYRKINHTGQFSGGMPKGQYELTIEYNFEVDSFGGSKNVVLTTQSYLGRTKLFLGIVYIIVGSICTLFGVIFLFVHRKWGVELKKGQNRICDMSR